MVAASFTTHDPVLYDTYIDQSVFFQALRMLRVWIFDQFWIFSAGFSSLLYSMCVWLISAPFIIFSMLRKSVFYSFEVI